MCYEFHLPKNIFPHAHIALTHSDLTIFWYTIQTQRTNNQTIYSGANQRKKEDPKLLKKALKRKAKKKAASAKAWNVRLDQAKDAASKKQEIRAHNLDQRKLGGAVAANLSSKRIVEQDDGGAGGDGTDGGGKKEKRRRLGPHSNQGRNRAGFEGKKNGFINGDNASSSGGGGKKGKKQ